MKDQVDKLTFLKTLEEAGVHFAICLPDGHGWIDIELSDVLEYAKDQKAWLAKYFGVTVDHFQAWERWMEADFPCYGITRKGTQCKLGTPRVEKPQDFQPGVSEYCDLHLGQSALHQQRRGESGTRNKTLNQ